MISGIYGAISLTTQLVDYFRTTGEIQELSFFFSQKGYELVGKIIENVKPEYIMGAALLFSPFIASMVVKYLKD